MGVSVQVLEMSVPFAVLLMLAGAMVVLLPVIADRGWSWRLAMQVFLVVLGVYVYGTADVALAVWLDSDAVLSAGVLVPCALFALLAGRSAWRARVHIAHSMFLALGEYLEAQPAGTVPVVAWPGRPVPE